jgi:geranyl-CoA carboxylase alpha subunit
MRTPVAGVGRLRKVFIANRGEIARRINRTLRDLGYATVAAVSDEDAGATWLSEAGEVARLGPAPDSYRSISTVVDAARASGADAVHPGYGFLSENAAFARACEDAGLVFIGPSPEAIEAMGSKSKAKVLMVASGIPVIPGYEGADQSDAMLAEAASRIGFPLMVKAAAGGGGRGMRLVRHPDELARALQIARSEANNAFGSAELILERVILDARHIEIQIFADAHGNVVHLGERDCSSQRRHQKVIEEAPSPAVSPELRRRMGECAVAAARAAGYRNAGTVEFILDAGGNFYFLEMNTRLQVEHAVTECVTGLDLVAWQILVAEGRALPLRQDEVCLRGHAIEARLYAEDPDADFLPQSGRLADWTAPGGSGIRVDHALSAGQDISPYYDPMIAKIIAHGEDREQARRGCLNALRHTLALGIRTNRRFLCALLDELTFVRGEVTTRFLDGWSRPAPDAAAEDRLWALASVLIFERARWRGAPTLRGWSSTGIRRSRLLLAAHGLRRRITIEPSDDGYAVRWDGAHFHVRLGEALEPPGHIRGVIDSRSIEVGAAFDGTVLHLEDDAAAIAVEDHTWAPSIAASGRGSPGISAPMAGTVTAVLVTLGDRVTKGQPLAVLEAMKMQHELCAPHDAVVDAIMVSVGEQVANRQMMVTLATDVARGGS